jgi:hypothetical protein
MYVSMNTGMGMHTDKDIEIKVNVDVNVDTDIDIHGNQTRKYLKGIFLMSVMDCSDSGRTNP